METWCEDTDRNRAEFERLKREIQSPRSSPRSRRDKAMILNQVISRENKYLRSLRRFLPGHEPDRNVL